MTTPAPFSDEPTSTPTTSTATPTPDALRASDAEREAVAERLRAAAISGHLTMDEADQRQTVAYAAVTRADLAPLTTDRPPDPAPPDQQQATRPARGRGPLTEAARRRLAVHAAIVGVLAVLLVTRWALDAAPVFWPVFPGFWLTLSVLLHAWFAPRAVQPTVA